MKKREISASNTAEEIPLRPEVRHADRTARPKNEDWLDEKLGTKTLTWDRYMARLGQSSDSTKMSYHPGGIPLVPGYIELIEQGDTLQGEEDRGVIRQVDGCTQPPDATA